VCLITATTSTRTLAAESRLRQTKFAKLVLKVVTIFTRFLHRNWQRRQATFINRNAYRIV
jgi:hypothetical protein